MLETRASERIILTSPLSGEVTAVRSISGTNSLMEQLVAPQGEWIETVHIKLHTYKQIVRLTFIYTYILKCTR